LGESRAAIKHSAGRRNCRRVLQQRRLLSLARLRVMDYGPAVVLSLFDYVHLIAPAGSVESRRTVLGFKHHVGARLPIDPLRVAIAVTPDLGPRFRLIHERIIRGHGAIVVQSKNLARERIEPLGHPAVSRVAGGDIEFTVGAETQPASGVK